MKNKDLMNTLQNMLKEAELGRKYWLELKEKYQRANDMYVILFPEKGTEINTYILKYLPKFVEKYKVRKILLITFDESVLEKKWCNIDSENVYWEEEKINALMSYYMLQPFTERLLIASLDKPAGRNGRNLIGVKGITTEEIVAIGILGLDGIE